MKNILFVGDRRDNVNWGCRSTSIALYQLLSKEFEVKHTLGFKHLGGKNIKKNDWITKNPVTNSKFILDRRIKHSKKLIGFIEGVDLVVINGEGSAILSKKPRRDFIYILSLIELCNRLNTPVCYINAIISDCPKNGRNKITFAKAKKSLSKCKLVATRDYTSYHIAVKELKLTNVEMIPDAVFSWYSQYQNKEFLDKIDKLDFKGKHEIDIKNNEDYLVLGGSSQSAKKQKKSIKHYNGLAKSLNKFNMDLFLARCCRGDRFLTEVDSGVVVKDNIKISSIIKLLTNANVFISGRYHPSIIASLGNTPCIFLKSNSHKTHSLQLLLNMDNVKEFNAYPTKKDNKKIIKLVERYLDTHKQYNLDILEKEVNNMCNLIKKYCRWK